MENDSLMLSLIIDAASISLPIGLGEDQLFAHYHRIVAIGCRHDESFWVGF